MKAEVLELLRNGFTESEIVEIDGFPDRVTILEWCKEDDDFKIAYDEAKLLYYNKLTDDLNAAASLLLDPTSEVTKAYADKVKRALEIVQFTSSKHAPAVYGTKPSGNFSLSGNSKNLNLTVEFVDAEPVTDTE